MEVGSTLGIGTVCYGNVRAILTEASLSFNVRVENGEVRRLKLWVEQANNEYV